MVSAPQDPKLTIGRTQPLQPFQLYAAVVSGLGLALLVWSLAHLNTSATGMLLFLGLVVIAELTAIETFTSHHIFSISSACVFAILLLLGPSPAALAAMAGGFVATLVTERRIRRQGGSPSFPLVQRAPFNMAANGLAVPVAGGIYLGFGGRTGELAFLSNLLPMILAAIAFEVVNGGLVIGIISIRTGQPAFRILRQNAWWITPMNVLAMVVGGAGLALGYQIAGILGVAVFFLPLVLTIYAYRMYVQQTRGQMASLEDLIAIRTRDLEKANEELKQLDQTKNHFFAIINHEMRTPLTAVAGYLSLIHI